MVLAMGLGAVIASTPPHVNMTPVPFNQVKITDTFWAPRQKTNREVTLRHSLDMLRKAGNFKNFELAAEGSRTGYSGPVYMDSDVYKSLEAVAYSLTVTADPALEAELDKWIDVIRRAQRPDGYLDTHYEVNEPDRTFTNLRDNHELYCAGHLFEAAVAHFRATGKRTFLDVAVKLADHIDATFGPGKRAGYPGHPEIELGLVKLADATGQRKYFDLAKFFIETRGSHFFATEHKTPAKDYDGTYWQDRVPIKDLEVMEGHAVRCGYLLAGATDIVARSREPEIEAALRRVWRNTTRRRQYVTGGIGPSASNEGFTEDFDLPNETAYQETCASVAMALWSFRMGLLYGDSHYLDNMESSLYNGMLAGYSWDGTKFFYVNPLASKGGHHRTEWFSCACCPPNASRMVASIGGYAYATTPQAFVVNLYVAGSVKAKVGSDEVAFRVATNYPWDGKVVVTADKPTDKEVWLRIPVWSSAPTVDGKKVMPGKDGYVKVQRRLNAGDSVSLDLHMAARQIEADPRVKQNTGRLAIARGPLVYCLEKADNKEGLDGVAVPAGAKFESTWDDSLVGGVVALTTQGVVRRGETWPGGLYADFARPTPVKVRAVPYYAWDHRSAGEMEVWVPTQPAPPVVGGPERAATVAMSFVNWNCQPEGVRDGREPKSSADKGALTAHWWNHEGTREWVSYTWDKPQAVKGCQVYWFDDTGAGVCRLPESWHVEALQDGRWVPVKTTQNYLTSKDSWNTVHFLPVSTTGLRLVVQMKKGYAAGVLQWRVEPVEDED